MIENTQQAVPDARFGAEVAADYDAAHALPERVVAELGERILTATGPRAGARLLEAGAGTGALSPAFLGAGLVHVALDSSPEMLARLRGCVGQESSPLLGNLTAMPFKAASFDTIVALRVLGVVPGWRRALRECLRVLHKGGSLVIGRIEHGPESVHTLLRTERNRLLDQMGLNARRPGAEDGAVLAALAAETRACVRLPSVVWRQAESPRRLVDRNLSGWRLQSLAPAERERLRRRLLDAAMAALANLDEPVEEEAAFVLHRIQV